MPLQSGDCLRSAGHCSWRAKDVAAAKANPWSGQRWLFPLNNLQIQPRSTQQMRPQCQEDDKPLIHLLSDSRLSWSGSRSLKSASNMLSYANAWLLDGFCLEALARQVRMGQDKTDKNRLFVGIASSVIMSCSSFVIMDHHSFASYDPDVSSNTLHALNPSPCT